MKLIDLSETIFGRLRVIKRAPARRSTTTGKKYVFWECKCSCGKTIEVNGTSLKTGQTKSCGCLKREISVLSMNKIRWNKSVKDAGQVQGKCIQCKGEIIAKPSRREKMKFCSLDCYWKSLQVERNQSCKECGKDIEIRPSHVRKFCSYKCFSTSRSKTKEEGRFRTILNNIIRNNGKNGRSRIKKEINLTTEDIKNVWEKQNGICPYTGWKLNLTRSGKAKAKQASLDRIDSKKGYIKGNIQFVALMANLAKNTFEEEELISFCKAVSRNIKSIPSDRN